MTTAESPVPRTGREAPVRRATEAGEPWERVRSFYRSKAVRRRILEYCGAEDSGVSTAWEIAGYGGARHLGEADGSPTIYSPPDGLERLLDEGADIARCLGDDRGSLVLLDIDYVNHEDPTEAYRDSTLCFETLEPVYRAVMRWFRSYGLRPLSVLSRQGYHVIGRLSRESRAQDVLSSMGSIGDPLKAKYLADQRANALPMGTAHDAIGRLLEYAGHAIIAQLRKAGFPVPVTLADVPPPGGGRFVCLDLSAYADPLYRRFARTAYSSHQKAVAAGISFAPPFVFCLPRRKRTLSTLLRARGSPCAMAELAEEDHSEIPRFGCAGVLRWIHDYRRSPLASFHAIFYGGTHDDPKDWPQTYDRLDLRCVEPEAALALESPNPRLLSPSSIRAVARDLSEKGWHPRFIAGLIRSKFERDYGWGAYWYRYDAAARADFYVRVLCGDLLFSGEEREA
jgi:hypothetical protein